MSSHAGRFDSVTGLMAINNELSAKQLLQKNKELERKLDIAYKEIRDYQMRLVDQQMAFERAFTALGQGLAKR